jgi:(p)ppGpp synthase/HD superfamily hydrolase
MNLIKVAEFAKKAHDGVKRKYGDDDYVLHPARVASRVMLLPGVSEEMIAAAWLHDVLEDVPSVTYQMLKDEFGEKTADLVVELTNPSKGSRAHREARKRQDRDHIANVSREAKLIKLIDRIDNLRDMRDCGDDSFIILYGKESLMLAEVLKDTNKELYDELVETAIDLVHNATCKSLN